MRLLTAISLALVVLMALACTATPDANIEATVEARVNREIASISKSSPRPTYAKSVKTSVRPTDAPTIQPIEQPKVAPTPPSNFTESEIMKLFEDYRSRYVTCLVPPSTGNPSWRQNSVPSSPTYKTFFEFHLDKGSYWSDIDISYKPNGVWLVIVEAGWEEYTMAVEHWPFWRETIKRSCTFRFDDATGSLIK